MPYKEWDGKAALYSNFLNEYIFEDVEEYLEEKKDNGGLDANITSNDLMLVVCDPIKLSQIDEDYWMDDLPEEGELPEEAVEALTMFNEILGGIGTVSWEPGKYRTSVNIKKGS